MRFRILLACHLASVLPLQSQHYLNTDIVVLNSQGKNFVFPWAGGLNNPQFSSGDLNNDGQDDLMIFDRSVNKVLTFINHGTPGTVDYRFAPEYEEGFPMMTDWALLQDYNCDQIPDLWCFTRGPMSDPGFGIQVYQGYYDANDRIQFFNVDSLLKYPVNNIEVNLFVSPVDIPALTDVTNDGDIDILTFQISGGFVMYFENQSQELGKGCDTLIYLLKENCWGNFYESGFNKTIYLNVPCPFMPGNPPAEASVRLHAGSASLAWDNTGDGIKEFLTGDISFSSLAYLVNCGTLEKANMCAQDTLFPEYNIPVDVEWFPAPFLVDVNNDGLRDLLVAPNAAGGSENYFCSLLYINNGQPGVADFAFASDTFLVSDMIDMGEGAHGVLFDANADGLLDVIVGNRGYFRPDLPQIYRGQLAYYQNIGTAGEPTFQLITKDYAGVGALNVTGICPTFGDLDGDGDADMLLGKEDGTLLYFQNKAASGQAAMFVFTTAFYGGIDVGNFSTPQLVDVNRDELLDLLIGEESGNINYYENNGTPSQPNFVLKTNLFGGVKVNLPGYLSGFSVPYLFDHNDGLGYRLLVGGDRGTLMYYSNIDGNLSGLFTLEDSMYSKIYVGRRSTVSGGDLNGDGKVELIVGNYRGGLTYWDSKEPVGIPTAMPAISGYPNPARDVYIVPDLGFPSDYVLMDLTGKVVQAGAILEKPFRLPVRALPSGVYVLSILHSQQQWVGKLVVAQD